MPYALDEYDLFATLDKDVNLGTSTIRAPHQPIDRDEGFEVMLIGELSAKVFEQATTERAFSALDLAQGAEQDVDFSGLPRFNAVAFSTDASSCRACATSVPSSESSVAAIAP